MRLAEPQDVLNAMGVQSGSGSLANALAALSLTGPIIEAMLDTDLDSATVLDAFDFDATLYRSGLPSFRLSRGFVNREETITFGGVLSGTVSDYYIDYERGIVKVKALPVSGEATIQYTAGFDAKGTNKILSGHPEWLRQAGIMAAVHYLQITPANIANKQNISMKDVTEPIRVLLSRSVNPHMRPRMALEFAARSSKVE